MTYLFPTIAFQIAVSPHNKREKLASILDADPHILDRASGPIDLLVRLIGDSSENSKSPSLPFLIIIDGLDECHGNDDVSLVLAQILALIQDHRLPFRFLIFSRPEPHIQDAFDSPPMEGLTKKMSLYGNHGARQDVLHYLRSEFTRIHDSKRHKDIIQFVPKPWPSEGVVEKIAHRSGGYFIYASTVIRYVDEEYFSCTERLEEVLQSRSDLDSTPFAELDNLYKQILSTCPKARVFLLKQVLGFMAFWPFSFTSDIEYYLRLQPGQVRLMLRGLHSLVRFKISPTSKWIGPRIHSFHASFLDFLLDEDRAGEYYIDRHQWYDYGFRQGFSAACDRLGLSVSTQKTRYRYDAFPL